MEEAISNILSQEVHISLEIAVYVSKISPIAFHLVSVNLLHILISNENICYKVVSALSVAFFQQIDESSSTDDIDTSRNDI